jgi:hypothetical protein
MKRILLLIAFCVILITSCIFITADINSTSYSGYITSGSSSGNITGGDYIGDTASFYQQAIGYLNHSFFSGIHGFTFNTSSSSGYAPTISIVIPENKTYITKSNLPLNFTSDNALSVWYKIDSGTNTTITENTAFNTTNGEHTLYLFANNTYGNSSTSVIFTSNETKFIVYYSNFSGSSRGESTNFNETAYEDLQNLSDIILENTNYGKIKFNQAINLTEDYAPEDNEIDINSNINISSNRIYLNSTALSNMNKSATLYLYGLTFTDPRILKDGVVCPSTICTEINYSSGTLIFNVTEFSTYSAEETPGETSPSGGGGGGSTVKAPFTVNKNQISVTLNPGQVKTEKITIKNTGSKIASIKINNQFQEIITLNEESISLKPGESKEISFNIIVKENITPELYLGKIIISSSSMEEEILFAIEVESIGILLDVRAEILKEYLEILPGESILAEIRLFNLGEDNNRKDIVIEYSVRDYENNEIVKEHESLAIETQATFIKRINIPENARYGKYVLYVKAIYEEKIASSSDNFIITSLKLTTREKIYIGIAIILLGILLFLIRYYILSKKKKGEEAKKIDLLKKEKEEEAKRIDLMRTMK